MWEIAQLWGRRLLVAVVRSCLGAEEEEEEPQVVDLVHLVSTRLALLLVVLHRGARDSVLVTCPLKVKSQRRREDESF